LEIVLQLIKHAWCFFFLAANEGLLMPETGVRVARSVNATRDC